MENTNNNKISVIISTYNGERFITQQLKSIVAQSTLPDEIIICDDCSIDKTVSKAESCLLSTSISFKIIQHKKNTGVRNSFSELMKQANGDYIFLCDQDDVWMPDKIERFLQLFKSENSDLVYSDAFITDSKLNKKVTTMWQENHFFLPNAAFGKKEIINEMLKRNLFTGMSMAVSRNLINKSNFNMNHMLHDEILGWTALRYGKISFLNECTAYYRQHGNNTVGVRKYTKYTNMKQAVTKVQESTTYNCKRIKEASSLFSGTEYESQLEKAIQYYEKRITLYSENRFKALSDYLFLLPYYSTYSLPTAHEKPKDLACILFHQ